MNASPVGNALGELPVCRDFDPCIGHGDQRSIVEILAHNVEHPTPGIGGLIASSEAADAVSCCVSPRILALDLSLTSTGWCRDGQTGRIRPKTRGWERIAEIMGSLEQLLAGADLVVLEGYAYAGRGRAVFDLAELGGIVRWTVRSRGVAFADVPPSSLKKYATGAGNANKDAMLAAAIRRFGFAGTTNDESDAFLLWCMAMHTYGEPVAPVPKAQAAALQRVAWPPRSDVVGPF
jgi:Holliday junction resolvasome RuvABC endonuclease subunit